MNKGICIDWKDTLLLTQNTSQCAEYLIKGEVCEKNAVLAWHSSRMLLSPRQSSIIESLWNFFNSLVANKATLCKNGWYHLDLYSITVFLRGKTYQEQVDLIYEIPE